jgi:hypothetical protein
VTPRIYSARICHYTGADALDISRKSATGLGLILAPSVALLKRFHFKWGGKMDWPAYEDAYLRELLRSDYGPLTELGGREEITLLCYCASARRCHRSIARPWLAGFLKGRDMGERGKQEGLEGIV